MLQAFVARLAWAGRLGFIPERIGGWWDRVAEIDLLAINQAEEVALVGDCKWSIHPVGTNVLEDLKKTAAVLLQSSPLRKVRYALFSRASFTPELNELAISQQVGLFSIKELLWSE